MTLFKNAFGRNLLRVFCFILQLVQCCKSQISFLYYYTDHRTTFFLGGGGGRGGMYEKNAKVNFVDLDYQTNIISIEYLLPYSVCPLYYRICSFPSHQHQSPHGHVFLAFFKVIKNNFKVNFHGLHFSFD